MSKYIESTTRETEGSEQTNNSTIEKYCHNNDENYCVLLGGLYEWDEAMQYITDEGTQGIYLQKENMKHSELMLIMKQ